jgi:proteasome accessory factor B
MLRIHEVLQGGKTPGVAELARRLEVSGKTVQRDVEFMRERLRLPVVYSRNHQGYRYTEPVTGFPSVQMTEVEVVALLVAHRALEQYRGTRFESALRSAFEKLTSSLGDDFVVVAGPEVSFRPIGASAHDLETFESLHRAVRERRETSFAYHKLKAARPEERRVRPHHLACVQGQWYVVAWDRRRDAMRTFALTRISRLRVLETRFERVQGFDIHRYFGNAFGVFAGEGAIEVRIRFDAYATRLVAERFWHPTQAVQTLPDGESELTLHLNDLHEITNWILGWGEHAVALAPAELVTRVRFSLAAAEGNYAKTKGATRS